MDNNQSSLVSNKQIVQEFADLLECSKQLFNGLRDLPQYGQRQWQPYFAKTFETYTKLWKFQQDNRSVLDSDYGLKRWQIGEIASKIGQLYYHYYLRTSETNYLSEAYQFYTAIRARNYYKGVSKESPDLVLKKHRYYARFIIVCLLLNYKQDVHDLVADFAKQVEENKSVLKDTAELEWDQVVLEVKDFLDTDPVQVLKAETYQKCDYTMRLLPSTLPPPEKGIQTIVTLGDAVVVGNSPSQLKFSELTIDMFRMVQVLERAPCDAKKLAEHNVNTNPAQETFDKLLKRENPHKYLLYRPTFFQLYTFISTAVKELPSGQALLLYLSAHGSKNRPAKRNEIVDDDGYQLGGVCTDDRKDDTITRKSNTLKDIHCLHPADLYAFTRKPMMIIVDSDNAKPFDNIPNLFGQPVICLLSPDELPSSIKDQFSSGRLLTCFLYSPLMAFMQVTGIDQTSDKLYETCSSVLDKVMLEIQRTYLRSRTIDHTFLQFFGDEFFRLILLRFAFCFCTLRMHRGYKNSQFYPKSSPTLPEDDFTSNSIIERAIFDLADLLGVRGLFFTSTSPT